MKLNTVFTVLAITAVAGVSLYILVPRLLAGNTYHEELTFNITGETTFKGHSYRISNNTVGTYKLEPGDTVSVEETSNPCGSSCLQFHHVLLINKNTGEIEDAAVLEVINPTELHPPSNETYTIGIGVLKSKLYSPENSIGSWKLTITIKKPF